MTVLKVHHFSDTCTKGLAVPGRNPFLSMLKHLAVIWLWWSVFTASAASLITTTTNVNLAWDPSPSPDVTGYVLRWGNGSGAYVYSNIYSGPITNAALTNLPTGTNYYFVVTAYNADGIESDFSNEVLFDAMLAMVPEPPPLPTNGTGGASSTGGVAVPNIATNRQTYLVGVPPNMTLGRSNGAVALKVTGTLGGVVQIQHSTLLSSPAGWQPVTNVLLTTPAPVTNPNPLPDFIDAAFEPASQVVTIEDNGGQALKFYRVVMPYSYPVLADQVLRQKGFNTHLVTVRLPGINGSDVCYVSQGPGYIEYDAQNYRMKWEPSGTTLREVANKLAETLSMNWTSASQFFHSNGVNQIISTVVKTDPPENDPDWATAPPPQIVIDF